MNLVLVTGASGFIGRAAIDALAGAGYRVRAAVRRPPHPAFAAGVEVVQHPDLAQTISWEPILEGVDAVIHLAGVAHTGRATAADLHDRVNRLATAQLAAAAAQAKVSRFIFVSSIRAQSGPSSDHALTENDPDSPTDAYGRSKLAAEKAVRAAGVPFTILRPTLVYGLAAKGNFALLLRAARSRLPLPVKEFTNRRSLLGVDNLVAALAFVLSSPATIGETYVVADPGFPPRISDVFAMLRHARGRWHFIVPMPTHYVEIPLRVMGRGDLWDRFGSSLRVDPRKLRAAGWRPLHDTREGLTALALDLKMSKPAARESGRQ